MVIKLRKIYRNWRLAIVTIYCRIFGKSDIVRWADTEELNSNWTPRMQRMAEMVPAAAHILEFGAGNMKLREFLPQDCNYIPSDIVSRGENCIVCDLNQRPLPELPKVDIIIFAGVLEYIVDVPALIADVVEIADTILVSYSITDVAGRRNWKRFTKGWFNSYSSKEFEKIFIDNGFHCEYSEVFGRQKLYKFGKITVD